MMSEHATSAETTTARTAGETAGSTSCARDPSSTGAPKSAAAETGTDVIDRLAIATHSMRTEVPIGEQAADTLGREISEVSVCGLAGTAECCCAWRRERAELAKLNPNIDWTDIIDPKSLDNLTRRGINLRSLPVPPLLVVGIDESRAGCMWLPATIEQIAAIDNPERRAEALFMNQVYGTCEAIRRLILSVQEAGGFGWAVQAQLCEPKPWPKKWPWWYRPYRRPGPEIEDANLFHAFGIDLETMAK